MCLINPIVGALNSWISNVLMGMSSGSSVVLGLILGAMMATDMGGPLNKAAYVFGTAALANQNEIGYMIMAAVMVGGMVPPLAIAISTMISKKKYTEATRQINTLAEEKKTLNEKVTLAAQLDATNIIVQPKNKRGKVIDKVKNVKKIAVSFTLVKNITAKTGERTLYVRIANPNNEVLTKNDSDTFPYENRDLTYSIKKYIEYTGEEQTVTVYWDVEEYLPAGTYNVYIFADGTMIGQQSFKMK